MEECGQRGGVYHRFLTFSAFCILRYAYLELHVGHLHLFMELVLSRFKLRPLVSHYSPGQLLCMFQRHPYILMYSCRVYPIQKLHILINTSEQQPKALRKYFSLSCTARYPVTSQVGYASKFAFYSLWLSSLWSDLKIS